MISIGDFVYDRNASANVRVLEINEAWGYTTYKVFNPSISGGIAAALYGNVSAEGIDIRKELRERLQELEDFGGKL